MSYEKVARLPFCTCPCDILSGVVLVCVLRRVFEQLVNSCAVLPTPLPSPSLVVLDRMLLACINFCIYAMYIQGVPGGKDLTSGECSLGKTMPI